MITAEVNIDPVLVRSLEEQRSRMTVFYNKDNIQKEPLKPTYQDKIRLERKTENGLWIHSK